MAPITTVNMREPAKIGVRDAGLPGVLWRALLIGVIASTLRNVDGSIKSRIYFNEDPDNEVVKRYMGQSPAMAVTWEVHGLQPYAECEFHLR